MSGRVARRVGPGGGGRPGAGAPGGGGAGGCGGRASLVGPAVWLEGPPEGGGAWVRRAGGGGGPAFVGWALVNPRGGGARGPCVGVVFGGGGRSVGAGVLFLGGGGPGVGGGWVWWGGVCLGAASPSTSVF